MHQLDYAQGQRRRSLLTIVCGGMALASAAGLLLIEVTRGSRSASAPAARPSNATAHVAIDADSIFDTLVRPALNTIEMKNKLASERAIKSIHTHFATARQGAPAFAESIIGPLDAMKTGWLGGKGYLERWWYKDPAIQPVKDHVEWNYAEHVTSGPKIAKSIEDAVGQLESDLAANRNEAIQSIRLNIEVASLPIAIPLDEAAIRDACDRAFKDALAGPAAANLGADAAQGTLMTTLVSSVTTLVVEQAVVGVTTRLLVGTQTGAAIGTLEPGPGNVIGAAAGMLAGMAVDMWMSSKDKTRTIASVDDALTKIENSVLNGDDTHPGLQTTLQAAAESQTDQMHQKLGQIFREAAQ